MTSPLAAVAWLPHPEQQAGSGDCGQVLPADVLALAEADADALADGLHDGALQALVVARYAADAAVRGGDAALARDAVQSALVALRHAVWRMRPRGARGLQEALDQLTAHLVATDGAPLHVEVDGDAAEDLAHLEPAAATAAYRLVQSVAGEAPLTVRVRRTPAGLRLSLDRPVAGQAEQALRARAVGGTLLATSDGASLLLPLTDPAVLPKEAS